MSDAPAGLLSRAANSLRNRSQTAAWRGFEGLKTAQQALARSRPDAHIFIFGCQRSGTTHLERLFRADLRSVVFGEYSALSIRPDRTLWRPLPEVHAHLARQHARYTVARSLLASHMVREVFAEMPEAVAIWLFRAPERVIASMLTKWQGDFRAISERVESDVDGSWALRELWARIAAEAQDAAPEADATHRLRDSYALFWYHRNRLFLDQSLADHPRVLAVDYRDLVADPARVTRAALSLAGLAPPRLAFPVAARAGPMRAGAARGAPPRPDAGGRGLRRPPGAVAASRRAMRDALPAAARRDGRRCRLMAEPAGPMMLAVATQDPHAIAETYVRQHMRRIAPGRTVGIGLACQGPPPDDLPFFCLPAHAPGLAGRLQSLSALLRSGYAGTPTPAAEARLGRFLEAHGVRCILAEFGPTGAALRRVCRSRGLRLFVNFHGYDATVMPRRARIRHAYRLLARDAEGVICGSQHFRQILIGLGFPPQKISVVPCGVDLAAFRPGQLRDRNRVIGVGRLTPKKAPDLLIRAFARAATDRPGLRLSLIGDGPLMPRCRELVAELGLQDRIDLLGAQPHAAIRDRLAAAGIFAQHSLTAPNGDQESQGISLVEAMAAALPVVTTDHNGFSETVLHGTTGLLSPEGDVPAMAAHLAALADAPERAAALGAAGRARAEARFDAEALTGRLRALLLPGKEGCA